MMSKEDRQNEAWKHREEGEPIKALAINHGLLQEYESESNWAMAINVLVDISIAWSVLGGEAGDKLYFQAAVGAIRHTKYLSDTHKVPLRQDYNFYLGRALESTGDYKDSEQALREYLGSEGGNLSKADVAEVEAHLGKVLILGGRGEEGMSLLKKSVETLEGMPESVHQGKDLVAIKRTGAKLKLASVVEDKSEAKRLVEEVVKEAEEKGLGAREKEASVLLEGLR